MCDKEKMSLLLSRLVDGDLTPQERGEVLRHVAECPDCAQDLEDLQLMHQFYQASPPPPAALKRQVLQAAREERPPRRRPHLRRAVSLAAAACLVIICALTLRFFPWGSDSTTAQDGAGTQGSLTYQGDVLESIDDTEELQRATDSMEADGAAPIDAMDGAAEYSSGEDAPSDISAVEYALYVLLPSYQEIPGLSVEESVISYSDAEALWPEELDPLASSYLKIVLPEEQLSTYVASYSEEYQKETVSVIAVEENTSGYGVLLVPIQ